MDTHLREEAEHRYRLAREAPTDAAIQAACDHFRQLGLTLDPRDLDYAFELVRRTKELQDWTPKG